MIGSIVATLLVTCSPDSEFGGTPGNTDAAGLTDGQQLRSQSAALTHGATSCVELEFASALWRFDASPVLSDIGFHAASLYDGAALATSTVPRFVSHLDLPSALAHAEAPNFLTDQELEFGAGAFSVATWVRADVLAGSLLSAVDTDGQGWSLDVLSSGHIQFTMVADSFANPIERVVFSSAGGVTIQTGVWAHVALTLDLQTGEPQFWIDGEPTGISFDAFEVDDATHAGPASGTDMVLGQGFEGALDDVVFASYVFAPQAIAALVDGDTSVNPTGCGNCDIWCPAGSVCEAGKCDARMAPSDLKHVWSFDESAGVIGTDSQSAAHAVGVPSWVTDGRLGSAASFDAEGGALLSPTESGASVAFHTGGSATWVAWVRTGASATGDRRIVGGVQDSSTLTSGWEGWELSLDSQDVVHFRYSNQDVPAPIELASATGLNAGGGTPGWSHVAITYEVTLPPAASAAWTLYVDGVSVDSATSSPVDSGTSAPLSIGGIPGGAGFDGDIDELFSVSRSLSAAEVSEYFVALHSAALPSEDLACVWGTASCDGRSHNGCETDVLADQNNCGTCGLVCPGTCTAGVCSSEICDNGVDDNGNGATDCADSLCTNHLNCPPSLGVQLRRRRGQ